MKERLLTLLTGIAALCASSLSAQFYGMESTELKTTMTLQSGGACWVRSETLLTRDAAEQLVRIMEAREGLGDAEEEDGAAPPASPKAKPVSDEEFAARYRKTMESTWENLDLEAKPVIERVEAGKDRVRLVWTNGFASIKALVDEGRASMELGGFSFETMRFEQNTNGHLQVTIRNEAQGRRHSQRAVEMWKRMKVKLEHRLVLPGKVLSSQLPSTDGTATWLALDWEKEETLKAGVKVESMAEVVVVAEMGGLKLDQPVESSRQTRGPFRQRAAQPGLPVTDAGPGFSVEAQSLELTTVHRFAGAPKDSLQRRGYRENEPGLKVRAQVFPPKGRAVKSVEKPAVLKAVDDQGRVLKARTSGEDEPETGSSYSNPRSEPVQIELGLELPAANAQSIEELSAQVVLSTVGKWRELSVTNIGAGFTNSIDLSTLLPGARLAITKVTTRDTQITIQATLTGPAAVRDIEFTAPETPGDRVRLHAYDQQTRTKDKILTRKVQISGYGFGRSAQPAAATILLRMPEDLRRERYQFKLTGLDLL